MLRRPVGILVTLLLATPESSSLRGGTRVWIGPMGVAFVFVATLPDARRRRSQ